MSIWKYLFDSEWQQRADIERLSHRSREQLRLTSRRQRQAGQRLEELAERVEELEEQVGSLQLLNRTLLAMLRDAPDWDQERFTRLLHELDLEDGRLDGQSPRPL